MANGLIDDATATVKICMICGAEYRRKTYLCKDGSYKIYSLRDWNNSTTCSLRCARLKGYENRKYPNLDEKFWGKVDKSDGFGPWGNCWEWTGYKDFAGYGSFRDGSKIAKSHRVSYKIANGELSPETLIRHKCDNPSCVNPDHLETGTDKLNSDDKISRGRENYTGPKLCNVGALNIFNDPRDYSEIAKDYGLGIRSVISVKTGETWSSVTGKVYTPRKKTTKEIRANFNEKGVPK